MTPEEAAALRAQLAASEVARALLEAQLRALEQRYDALLERLRTDSRSSSKPPSSDGPSAPPRTRPPSGNKRGGQKGHKGHSRRVSLAPDALVELVPSACRACASALHGCDPDPVVHQVVDLDDRGRVVTNYLRHRLRCGACGRKTRAPLPAGMTRSPFGPRLRAWLAVLPPRFRLGRREVAALARETFGITLSVGTVSALERLASEAVEPTLAAAKEHLEKSPVAHVDETPLKGPGKRGTLWAACTSTVSFFVHAKSRARSEMGALLGAFAGVLVTDRYGAYWHWADERHQYCWAHVVRNLLWLTICVSPSVQRLGEKLVDAARTLLHAWNEVKRGAQTRASFDEAFEGRRRGFVELLREGAKMQHERAKALCRGLLYDELSFWTFVKTEGVDATNNRVERSLRAAVRWRKVALGTQSDRGSRFLERMLTVCETLRLQGKSLVTWVEQCLRAKAGVPGVSVPALLPAEA